MVTTVTTLCGGFALLSVMVPEYVPAARPAGLAVTVTGSEANAPRVPLAGEAVSQPPPDVVEARAVNASDPPPAFEAVSVCARAGDWRTNENVRDDGFTLSDGWPAAVTVSVTATV